MNRLSVTTSLVLWLLFLCPLRVHSDVAPLESPSFVLDTRFVTQKSNAESGSFLLDTRLATRKAAAESSVLALDTRGLHFLASYGASDSFVLDTRLPGLPGGFHPYEVVHVGHAVGRKTPLLSNPSMPPAKICADGSLSTLFRFFPRAGEPLYSLKLKSAPSLGGEETHGKFSYAFRPGEYIYKHPDHFLGTGLKRSEIVEVRRNGQLIHEIPIEIYRAPVLMAHGLWGDPSGFEAMEAGFMEAPPVPKPPPAGSLVHLKIPRPVSQNSKWPGIATFHFKLENHGGKRFYRYTNEVTYSSPLILRYKYPNEASFSSNRLAIKKGAEQLLEQAIAEGYSAGRVDVVAHSMGGVLTRLYLQQNDEKRDLIRRLITLDTPHWGSQFANWLQGGTPGAATLSRDALVILAKFFNAIGSFDSDGVRDLRVSRLGSYPSGEIDTTRMLGDLAKEIQIPSHFITSKNANASSTGEKLTKRLIQSAKADGFYTCVYDPNPNSNGKCTDPDPIWMLEAIFGSSEHDQIVALQSQLGGLPESSPGVTVFDGFHHVGVQGQPDVIDRVFDLLSKPRSADEWTARVQPRPASYVYDYAPRDPWGDLGMTGSPSIAQQNGVEDGELTITLPDGETSVQAGARLRVGLSSEDGFTTGILSAAAGESVFELAVTLPGEVEIQIPPEAVGALYLQATTHIENGAFAAAYRTLPIIPIGDPILLTTSLPPRAFVLVGGDLYYSARVLYEYGGGLSVTEEDGITVEILHPDLADVSEWGKIRGLADGETTVTLRFGDLETTVCLTVLPADSWDVNRYTLAFLTDGTPGAALDGPTSQTVVHGDSATTVTAIPPPNHRFDRWVTDWGDYSTSNPLVVYPVMRNMEFVAVFDIHRHTLTYTAGMNGSIAGEAIQTIAHGANGTPVEAVPDTGFRFIRWSDGSIQNPRTDTFVTESKTVIAEFEKVIVEVWMVQ